MRFHRQKTIIAYLTYLFACNLIDVQKVIILCELIIYEFRTWSMIWLLGPKYQQKTFRKSLQESCHCPWSFPCWKMPGSPFQRPQPCSAWAHDQRWPTRRDRWGRTWNSDQQQRNWPTWRNEGSWSPSSTWVPKKSAPGGKLVEVGKSN